MGWFGSIVVGVLTAVCSAVAAGFIADRATLWLRVSQVEGNAGFMALGFGLLGLVGGLVVGIVVARTIGDGGFLRSLGIALAIGFGTIAAGGALAWLGRDEGPAVDGRPLMLEFELRLGPGITLAGHDPYQLYAYLAADGATSQTAKLVFDPAAGTPVTGRVAINTRRADPYIAVGGHRFQGRTIRFDVVLPRRAQDARPDWSEWGAPRAVGDAAGDAGLAGTRLRYRAALPD